MSQGRILIIAGRIPKPIDFAALLGVVNRLMERVNRPQG
jgi:hypothetical protein